MGDECQVTKKLYQRLGLLSLHERLDGALRWTSFTLCPNVPIHDGLLKVLTRSKEAPKAVSSGSLKVNANAMARLALLKSRLFKTVCRRVCRGLLNKDRLLFALRLAQV